MSILLKEYKFCGMSRKTPHYHEVIDEKLSFLRSGVRPVKYVKIGERLKVPQYAETISGTPIIFAPQTDCLGYFTSAKFQIHNNCYNYACGMATNSYAQPGRMHGFILKDQFTAQNTISGAIMDGLIFLDGPDTRVSILVNKINDLQPGHCVALLISEPIPNLEWTGDYHWVRCDDAQTFGRWSQKDGPDQVTNFDFLGAPITDPKIANWEVNQGPLVKGEPDDIKTTYAFVCYMFVPHGRISII